MKYFQVLIIATIIALSATSAHAINLDGHRDKYIHFGGSALCSYTIAALLESKENREDETMVNPNRKYWVASTICTGLNLFKELIVDSKFDRHDFQASVGGVLAGLTLTWSFE